MSQEAASSELMQPDLVPIESWFNGNQTEVTLAMMKLTKQNLVAGLQLAALLGNVIGHEKVNRMVEAVAERYDLSD